MALGGIRGIAPSIFNLGAIWRRVGKYKARPLYGTEITRYQLNRRRIGFRALLEGLDKRKKSLATADIRTRDRPKV